MLGPSIIRFNVHQRYSFWIKRHWNLVNFSIKKQTISQCDSDWIIGVWPNIGIFTLHTISKIWVPLSSKMTKITEFGENSSDWWLQHEVDNQYWLLSRASLSLKLMKRMFLDMKRLLVKIPVWIDRKLSNFKEKRCHGQTYENKKQKIHFRLPAAISK